MINNDKYKTLISHLSDLGKIAVAYSGGVDSSFLLAAAKIAVGENAVGITIDSPALPRYELEDSKRTAALIGAKHIIVESPDIEEEVKQNPVNRCYFCKKLEFGSVIAEALKLGINNVIDGSNADDVKDFRPGIKATRELKVASPLLELGITKNEVREFSKELNLPTWNKPAYACLFSRIPYGQEIKTEDLIKVEKSEKFFIDKGFRTIRVRCHDTIARIEVLKEELESLFREPLREEINLTLKSFGFKYVTIDIEGYRMGSMNEVLNKL
jgi:pyridinium-3,5-biscarboxylic acid mononucleotide sulfurtransferase